MTVETVTPWGHCWTPESPREKYEALVSPHLGTLRRWVLTKVRNNHDAEDVVQQTLLLAYRHLEQFRFEASFGTWLCRIALNVIRGRMRSPDFSRLVAIDPRTMENFNLHDKRQSPLSLLESKEARIKVHSAISKLPDMYRVVVEMRDLRGFSIQETADSLGLTRPAIKSRHHRARLLMHRFLSEKPRPEMVN